MGSQALDRRTPAHPAGVRERYDRMVRGAGGRGRDLRLPTGRVHVVESGDGPPVVHLHGNNTSSLSHLMLLEHSTGVRTCLVDRPGFGLSDSVDFPRTAFRQRSVALVEAVIDALDLESAFLVGASGGGSWAVWTALDRPARVRGVVMLGSVPLLPGARIPVPIRLMATPVLGALVARVVKPGRSMLLAMMRSVGEADTIVRHPELLDSLVDAAHDPVASAANVAELQALFSPFGQRTRARIGHEELRRLTVPTLMIWGDRDPVVPVAAARAVAAVVPNARLEVLRAGHVPQLGHPEQVAELIRAFVRAHP